MSSKIDLTDVFKEHFETMRDEYSGKMSVSDVIIFFLCPIVLALGVMSVSSGGFDATSSGIWIGALSILAGLMVNVLVLLYTVKAVGPSGAEEAAQIKLIKEVNANILFSILVAIIAISLLCVVPLFDKLVEKLISGVIICLLANFALTLLMTLKRLKTLVDLRFRPGANI